MPANRQMEVTTFMAAPRPALYQAFLDPALVAAWMAPGTMTATVHAMEAHAGGQFRVSLTYTAPEDTGSGKTSSTTDTYHGRFVTLVPNELIVEAIEFETDNPAMTGDMTLTVQLADAPGGSRLTMRYDNLPAGVSVADNELGTRLSLEKLAALLGQRRWRTYTVPEFPLRFQYPDPTPQGRPILLAEELQPGAQRVHCRTADSAEVYFETTWYTALAPEAEYARHIAQLAQRFAAEAFSATPITSASLDGRPAYTYGFAWASGARTVVTVPLGAGLCRVLYNPRLALNTAILATLTISAA